MPRPYRKRSIMDDKIKRVREILREAKKIAVLTGAGISAESGVPTFRGEDGIWKKFTASELATPEAFRTNPRRVWEWYGWRRGEMLEAKPNPGHYALAEIEKQATEFALITQNIDNMHILAGSRNVLEIHGNIFRNRCTVCGQKEHDERSDFSEPNELPICGKCGSPARVDVVWFGEQLPERELSASLAAAESCDVFISAGTSALVYPAAHFPELAKRTGATLIEVNLEPTHLTQIADFSFLGKTGEILPELVG